MLELGLEDLNRTSPVDWFCYQFKNWWLPYDVPLAHRQRVPSLAHSSPNSGRVHQISDASRRNVDGIGLSLIPKNRWYHLLFKMSYKNTHTMTDTVMDTIAVVDSTMLQVCGLFRISRILHIFMIQLRHCGKITLVFLFKRVYDIENKYRGACVSRLRGSNRTSTLNLMRIMPP